MLRLGDDALSEHLVENDGLTFLVLVGVDIGVVDGGIVRNADQRGAFGQIQVLDVLAEIDLRGALHAGTVLAQIDDVEIPLQDFLLGILLFEFQGAEDFHNLPANRNLLLTGQILDKLLRYGGAAGRAGAQEHFHARLDCRIPVDALVIEETLVLDGHAGLDQIVRYLAVFDPGPVFPAVELLQHNILACGRILAIDDRGLVERKAFDGKVDLLRQIIFYIKGKQAGKNQRSQKHDQNHRPDHFSDRPPDTASASGPFCGIFLIFLRHRTPPLQSERAAGAGSAGFILRRFGSQDTPF